MRYIINNKIFTSKKKCYDYTKKILYSRGYGIIGRGDDNFDYLWELIKLHPRYTEKLGVGLKHFRLSQNAINKTTIQMDLERLDHSIVSCSWNIQTYKNPNPNLLLSQAMRNSVKDQTISWKNILRDSNGFFYCKYCEYKSDIKDWFHLDHITPFSIIKKDFLKHQKTKPTKFNKDYNNITCFKPQHKTFERKWNKYHEKHTRYQILCRKCNTEKSDSVESE